MVTQQAQLEAELIEHAEYLSFTRQCLAKIKQYTETDEHLQLLTSAVLESWPDQRRETAVAIREYWTFRDEISMQNGVLFKSDRVIIPKKLHSEMLRRIYWSHMDTQIHTGLADTPLT